MGNKAKQAEGKRVEEEAGIGDGGGGGGEWRVVFLMVSCRSALKLEPFLIIFSTISLTLSLSLSSPSILSLSSSAPSPPHSLSLLSVCESSCPKASLSVSADTMPFSGSSLPPPFIHWNQRPRIDGDGVAKNKMHALGLPSPPPSLLTFTPSASKCLCVCMKKYV